MSKAIGKEQLWQQLKEALETISQQKTSSLSYQDLYKCAYDLIQQKQGDYLYRNIQDTLDVLIREVLYKQTNNSLLSLITVWKQVKLMLQTVNHIFLYINKKYCVQKKCKPIYVLGVEIFGKIIFQNQQFDQFINQLLNLIQEEDNMILANQQQYQLQSVFIDRQLLFDCIQFIKTLGTKVRFQQQEYYNQFSCSQQPYLTYESLHIYEKYFEQPLIQQKQAYYESIRKQYNHNDLSSYLRIVENSLQMIKDKECIEKTTQQGLINCLLLQLLGEVDNKAAIDLIQIIQNQKENELRRIIILAKEDKECLCCLSNLICKAFRQLAIEAFEDNKQVNHLQLVGKLTTLLLKVHSVLEMFQEILVNNGGQSQQNLKVIEKQLQQSKQYQDLQIQLTETVKKALNSDPKGNLLILSLIKYIDYNYQKHFKLKSDQEVDGILDNILMVFKYINDKDIFISSLQKSIARRLLNGSSFSEQYEKQLVVMLRQEMGGVYTGKLDKMFQDLQVQRGIQNDFNNQNREGNEREYVQLEVKLLTQGIWPIETKIKCIFPPMISQLTENYLQFYNNKFQSRKITWVPELGLVDLRFNITPQRKKELLVSTFQMLILLQFNRQQQITMQTLMDNTGLFQQDLLDNLQPLLDLQVIVEKDNAGQFVVNNDFQHKNYKIKVPVLKKKSNKNGGVQLQSSQFLERKLNIEIQIIRIMKRRKEIQHQQLCNEISQLINNQFVADQSLIKTCIESLINRDYIERKNNDTYLYLP